MNKYLCDDLQKVIYKILYSSVLQELKNEWVMLREKTIEESNNVSIYIFKRQLLVYLFGKDYHKDFLTYILYDYLREIAENNKPSHIIDLDKVEFL